MEKKTKSDILLRRAPYRKSPPAYARLGRRIRSRRLHLGLKYTTLERKTGISRGRLSMYEFGSLVPGREPLTRIAEALGADIHTLWRVRASTLVAMEVERLVHRVRLMGRQSIAIIERDITDESDIRIRRPEPIEDVA